MGTLGKINLQIDIGWEFSNNEGLVCSEILAFHETLIFLFCYFSISV